MATFPSNTKIAGVSRGLTTDLDTVYSLLQSILGPVWLPSADDTGTADPAGIAALFTLGATTVTLLPGATYYGDPTVDMGLGQFVYGDPSVTWNNVGSGYAFSITNSGTYSSRVSAGVYGGFIIDCANTASAGGIEFGDIRGIKIDVHVRRCLAIGAHALNGNHWTEQGDIRLTIEGCTRGVVLERTGTGTNSWERTRWDLNFIQQASQTGLELGGSSGDADITQGKLWLKGNFTAGATNTGTVIQFNTANSVIQDAEVHVGVECDGTAGQTGHQTMNFGASSNKFLSCYGNIDFLNGTVSFAESNNSFNFGGFTGPVKGDPSLLVSVQTGVALESTGLPTGWTGTVNFDQLGLSGYMICTLILSIASGTVVTNGETFLTTVPAPFIPTVNKRFVVDLSGTPVTVQLTTTGTMTFLGTGFTASGTEILHGHATYANSY